MHGTKHGTMATVGRPPVQCRACPEGLSYIDWGATGGPRNRYLTREEGEPAGHSPCSFSHRPHDSTTPPPPPPAPGPIHTHIHARRMRTLSSQTPN